MSKKTREEFEAWVAKHHDGVKYARGLEMVLSGERYASMEVEWAYRGWQASRAELCVELPDVSGHYGHSKYMHGVVDCRTAIHSAGVKTK
jgi:hypothetical protein